MFVLENLDKNLWVDQIKSVDCNAKRPQSPSDYRHNILLSTGNFLCSAPSVNSTMDFSKKRVEDGVVENLVEKKVQVAVVSSPSSLHANECKAATMSISDVVRLMQRKVYEDANYGTMRK